MPRQHFTSGKDPVPIVQEAGWASEPVWTGAENVAPPGFDPRTVQPVGSRYTDYTTRPTRLEYKQQKHVNLLITPCITKRGELWTKFFLNKCLCFPV